MSRREILLSARVELRDIKQRVATLIGEIDEELNREDRMYERIMAEVRQNVKIENCRFDEPNHNPVGIPCASTGEPPLPAHGCWDACDDPDAELS